MTRVWYRVLLPARIWEDPPALRSYIHSTLWNLPELTKVPCTMVVGQPDLQWTAYKPPVLDDEGRCIELEQQAPQDIHAPLPDWASAVAMVVLAELAPVDM